MAVNPTKSALQPQSLVLDDGQRETLLNRISLDLQKTLRDHEQRQKFLAKLLRSYKAIPEFEVKNFPWPNASNVVIPIVAITVDTIASRLQRAVFGAKDPVEAHVNTSTPFVMTVPPDPNDPSMPGGPMPLDDKILRDWCRTFLAQSGAQDRLRTVFADMPLYGDAFISPIWSEDKRVYHAYDAAGEVVTQEVPAYTGVKWNVAAPTDVFWPTGFDEWDRLPKFWLRLRYNHAELTQFVKDGVFEQADVDKLKPKMREDEKRKVERKTEHVTDEEMEIYEVFELRGLVQIPSTVDKEGNTIPAEYEEVVITHAVYPSNILLRAIYNPYFGKARHFVKIPYLVQPHELPAIGAAEQSLPFQEEATTSHNQVIDAATAANAGITVVSNDTSLGPNEEIHPGKTITTDGDPNKGLAIFHLSEPSAALGAVEEKAFFMNEKRTGVSVYNLGMESPTVGSRATATGTTALINEGNMRFWVSIDDMRKAIEEIFYLTIQQEQQMRPEGYFFEKGRFIQFPPGDPRQSIALRLSLSSESVNRDIEVQQMQIMMQVVNEYYMRLNQAMMMIVNPSFPPAAKMMAVQIMQASSQIVRKFVERFDVENLDQVVPTILSALQAMAGMMQGAQNGQAPGGGVQSPGAGAGAGPGQGNGAVASGGRPNGNAPPPGGMPVS